MEHPFKRDEKGSGYSAIVKGDPGKFKGLELGIAVTDAVLVGSNRFWVTKQKADPKYSCPIFAIYNFDTPNEFEIGVRVYLNTEPPVDGHLEAMYTELRKRFTKTLPREIKK